MGNLVIANSTIIDAAEITAGSESLSMPATNVQNPQPSKRWRTDGLSDMYLEIDLGSALAINLIAALYHTGTQAATWRIRAATSQGDLTADPDYDSTAIDMWEDDWPADQSPLHAIHWLGDTPQTYRWWRVDFIDAGNPDDYIEVGRLYIDAAWQLPDNKNISYGWGLQFVDPSPAHRSKGGQHYVEALDSWRTLQAAVDWLDEDQMYDNLYELQRRRGHRDDVLVIRDPDATTHLLRQSVYGRMAQIQPIVHAKAQVFRTRILVEEML